MFFDPYASSETPRFESRTNEILAALKVLRVCLVRCAHSLTVDTCIHDPNGISRDDPVLPLLAKPPGDADIAICSTDQPSGSRTMLKAKAIIHIPYQSTSYGIPKTKQSI